ncbi:DUF6440 family protein [Jeotgalibacillus proteolyticus]|uniref:DUF6440 family protein n=1 Tax=Jeotgalibacillus proteolyticus TaxID=2082395 RepID=UPI003CEF573F
MFGSKKEKRFEEISVQHYQYGLIMLLVDTETGVNYMHAWTPQGISLTPLLDENGDVVVSNR